MLRLQVRGGRLRAGSGRRQHGREQRGDQQARHGDASGTIS